MSRSRGWASRVGIVMAIAVTLGLGAGQRNDAFAGEPWAPASLSPALPPVTSALAGPVERAAAQRCGVPDERLAAVARAVLAARAGGRPMPDPLWISAQQQRLGEPHPWARVWMASEWSRDPGPILMRLETWLGERAAPGERRCGVAVDRRPDGSERTLAVVSVDALADLSSLPMRARTGQWVTVEARLRVPVRGAQVLVMGPAGLPRPVFASIDGGIVRAAVAFDEPGRFIVQVMADLVDGGPRPVLEASVFADVSPGGDQEDAVRAGACAPADSRGSDAEALRCWLASSREQAGLGPLSRDTRLDVLASEHAARMARRQELSHDLDDGDPARRVRDAGVAASIAGENVAHAQSAALGYRLLWASPSHRANILRPAFQRADIGVARGPSGELWIDELFTGD